MVYPWIENNKIFECVAGSHAYGFATPESDEDVRGITIPEWDYIIGVKQFEQYENKKDDVVIYGLKKFLDLAANNNPNIIELLYMPKKHIRFINYYGDLLFENANLFLSKKAKFTFSGYAIAQLKRIEQHKKWIDNPPVRPNPADYVRTKYMILKERDGSYMPTKVDKSIYDNFNEAKWAETFVDSKYESDLKHYQQYCTWKKERNPKRAALEEKFGYDTKHATHLVRLLRMGQEILREGKVYVDRRDVGDADELIAIRNGAMSYDELVSYAVEQDEIMKQLYETCTLQHTAQLEKIGELYKEIINKRFGVKLEGEKE